MIANFPSFLPLDHLITSLHTLRDPSLARIPVRRHHTRLRLAALHPTWSHSPTDRAAWLRISRVFASRSLSHSVAHAPRPFIRSLLAWQNLSAGWVATAHPGALRISSWYSFWSSGGKKAGGRRDPSQDRSLLRSARRDL